MSELRRSLTGRWVIVAPERQNRPNAFRKYEHVKDPEEIFIERIENKISEHQQSWKNVMKKKKS